MYRKIKTIPREIDLYKTVLYTLNEWADKWRIKLNLSKCQMMKTN